MNPITIRITLHCQDISLKDNHLILEQKIILPKNSSTYIDLFNELKKSKLLIQFDSENAVLVLTSKRFPCIFSYYTKTGYFSEGLAEKRLRILNKDNVFVLQYYDSVENWKKTFYKWYDNNEYYLWRDGWTNEIQYCNKLIEESS